MVAQQKPVAAAVALDIDLDGDTLREVKLKKFEEIRKRQEMRAAERKNKLNQKYGHEEEKSPEPLLPLPTLARKETSTKTKDIRRREEEDYTNYVVGHGEVDPV